MGVWAGCCWTDVGAHVGCLKKIKFPSREEGEKKWQLPRRKWAWISNTEVNPEAEAFSRGARPVLRISPLLLLFFFFFHMPRSWRPMDTPGQLAKPRFFFSSRCFKETYDAYGPERVWEKSHLASLPASSITSSCRDPWEPERFVLTRSVLELLYGKNGERLTTSLLIPLFNFLREYCSKRYNIAK